MTELKKTFEPVTYENSGHGFMRAGDAPEPADKAAADYQKALETWKGNKKARDDAWARWKKLLAGV
jgi:carboxymethylenebutenolidase